MNFNYFRGILLMAGTALIFVIFTSCKKGWLDAKPNKSLVIPTTIGDYQALLDNSNNLFNIGAPGLGDVSADDYYLPVSTYQSRNLIERNTYVWAEDLYEGLSIGDWDNAYSRILNANIILEGIEKVSKTAQETAAWNNVKGSALFYRGFDFFNLAQLFSKVYDPSTAASDLGIPLRLTANINDPSVRSNLQQTYDQIISDIKQSISLLPVTPVYKTRPSQPAAYGLLSRIYLSMSDYGNARKYADSTLKLTDSLVDYNTLNPSDSRPFKRYNAEVIFHNLSLLYGAILLGRVDSTLLASYATNDLRGPLFFNSSNLRFKGSYDGSSSPFNGLATDEMYLIRAECKSRSGDAESAMNDLNLLLEKRWKTGTFVPFTAPDADAALAIILEERRKELCFRQLRWSDLKRLNKDLRFAKSLTRILDAQTVTLPANDPKYVLPIPQTEINLSGIEQNPR